MTTDDRAALLAPVEAALADALSIDRATQASKRAIAHRVQESINRLERRDIWTPIAYPEGARKPRFLSNAATVRANHLMHPDYIPRRAL